MKRLILMLVLSWGFGAAMARVSDVDPDGGAANADVERVIPTSRVIDQPNALLSALKQNDFAAFLEASERNSDIVEIAKTWDERASLHRETAAKRAAENAKENAGAEFSMMDDTMQQTWQKLQSNEGVDLLVSEWQPKIAEEAGSSLMQFNVGFGAMLTSIASDKDLSAHEVQQLTQLMYAVQNWSGRVDFADAERLRRALLAVSRLVRQTGAKSFDETQALSFEEAVVHGDTLIKTIKQVLAAYDIDADEILNSVRLSEVDAFGDKATLHAEARVFGVDISHDFKKQFFEGDWQDVDVVEAQRHWRETEAKQSQALEAAKAAADAAASAAKAADADAAKEPNSAKSDAELGSCSPKNQFADEAVAE
jgi:hypothetical protein